VEALGTVFVAAAKLLKLRIAQQNISIDGMEIDHTHATDSLRHHGFLLLDLEEFVNL
jgi:hypothetical protein